LLNWLPRNGSFRHLADGDGTRELTYGDASQIATFGGTTFLYESNGNLASDGNFDEFKDSAMDTLKDYWASKRVQVAPGCSISDIEGFQRRYNVAMPSALRSYYLAADGMQQTWDGQYDHNGFSFWPLRDVVPVADFVAANRWQPVSNIEGLFMFADYLHLS
jgi:hypothetical protein